MKLSCWLQCDEAWLLVALWWRSIPINGVVTTITTPPLTLNETHTTRKKNVATKKMHKGEGNGKGN
jgi:hypothetical protein